MRCLLGILGMALLSACGGRSFGTDDGGTGDPIEVVRAVCELRMDSPSACDAACLATVEEASMDCGSSALAESSEWADFMACLGACPLGLTCGETFHFDCECSVECLRARSEGYVELHASIARCVDEAISGVCY